MFYFDHYHVVKQFYAENIHRAALIMHKNMALKCRFLFVVISTNFTAGVCTAFELPCYDSCHIFSCDINAARCSSKCTGKYTDIPSPQSNDVINFPNCVGVCSIE